MESIHFGVRGVELVDHNPQVRFGSPCRVDEHYRFCCLEKLKTYSTKSSPNKERQEHARHIII